MAKNKNTRRQSLHLPKDVAEALRPEFAALHRRWIEVVAAINAEDGKFDRTGDPSKLAAIRARQNLLWRRKRKIIQGIASFPSRSVAELAIKMRLWRSESSHWTSGVFDDLDGPCAFSVYWDLLRLSGIKSLDEKHDQRSLRRLRSGRFLAGD